MEKAQILDRIRNKLTLPRAMLQIMNQLNLQQKTAIQEIDESHRDYPQGDYKNL